MIRFIKEDPFVAPMVLSSALIFVFITLMFLVSIINPQIMQTCPNGFVRVDTPQGKGCVSDAVWKDMQK